MGDTAALMAFGEGTAAPGRLPTPELQRDASVSCRGPDRGSVSPRPRAVTHAAVVRYALGLRPLWRLKAALKPKASA